ncbi:hypothetical protein IPJ70_02900 [Candidatus Campbellbacteria bacterium]|nr:MAG: hypothetical protein IPJ70_02900 [Candidatus Campbellbacteria bacterium]
MEGFEHHASEVPVTPELPERRLELVHRNMLRRCIIQRSLGAAASNSNAVYEWGQNYLGRISEALDSPEREDIRERARKGDYEEVAAEVIALLHIPVEEPPRT